MNSQQRLLDTLLAADAAGEEVVLATVVKVEGSAYRRPGARMLIPRFGGSVGTISGGCLEGHVSRRAWWLTEGGQAALVRYATGGDGEEDDEEAELAFGLGCNGTIHVLLERPTPGASDSVAALLREVQVSGNPAALATVIASEDPALPLATRAMRRPDGTWTGTASALAGLEGVLRPALDATLASRRHSLRRFEGERGTVECFLEYLAPPPRLVVFGAGHDAEPLVRLAAEQGWRVTVIDSRAHFALPARFPGAETVLCQLNDTELKRRLHDAAVVIMTHSLSQDRRWLGLALSTTARYVGQLGPRQRTERLLDELRADGLVPADMSVLHSPVGLDLGGDTPEAVALAILAELTAHQNRRDGGMLTRRDTPIHAPDHCVTQTLPVSQSE